jgi:hypothetical protein
MPAELSSHTDPKFVICSSAPIDINYLKHEELLKINTFVVLANGKEK